MNKENREIEVKFKIETPQEIIKKLRQLGAQFQGKAFEKTIRFDTENDSLAKQDKFLRLRSGFKNVITFKAKVANDKFKEREEIETEVKDQEKMRQILERLGFTKLRVMEKYRQKWNLGGVEIVIDKLPMGTFIEIEGSESEIKKTAEKLELDFQESLTNTYWDLWVEYAKKNKLSANNIVFS